MKAYFHIDIHPSHRRFLFNQDHYQFGFLPYGLATAIRVSAKLFSVGAAWMRRRRFTIFSYLDNWLLMGTSYEEVQLATHFLLHLLPFLEVCVNDEKCHEVRISELGALMADPPYIASI